MKPILRRLIRWLTKKVPEIVEEEVRKEAERKK